MGNLAEIKRMIFDTDDKACFIERERIFARLDSELCDYTCTDKPALVLSRLLSEVSTPIYDCDYFAGRCVEARPDEEMNAPNPLLCSTGHMSFDYEKIFRIGLEGILSEITENAERSGEESKLSFARNAKIVIYAIRDFAKRYAVAAKEKGFSEMARALETVPFEPAYDFYSALQGMWLLHMIASCYVGSRDYAFGRFDKLLYPFYKKSLAEGKTKEELTELLAGFFVKTNEICGMHPHNYDVKPVFCQSSKQYVNIGGEDACEFSLVVLEAAKRVNMAQPQIVVLLKKDTDKDFENAVFDALAVLKDKMNIYNYDLVLHSILKKGVKREVAKDFTYSACCTFDLNYHTYRREYFLPTIRIFTEVLQKKDYSSVDELLCQFKEDMAKDMQYAVDENQKGYTMHDGRIMFVLDSLLLSDTATKCVYPFEGSSDYNIINIFCPGIATLGDSLMAIDKLVFKEKRFTYRQFAKIVGENFSSNAALRAEILSFDKFGNDTDADDYAVLAANTFLSATEQVKTKENFFIAPSFYSLERDNSWASELGATPDGRLCGEPFSENQSPTYGADKNGITALLCSVAKLPFDSTFAGGLNITFSKDVSPEMLKAVIRSYFGMGGIHAGITVVDKKILENAMETPEKYKSLTVRLYGFSEYFVNLPKWQQLALLKRTEYDV